MHSSSWLCSTELQPTSGTPGSTHNSSKSAQDLNIHEGGHTEHSQAVPFDDDSGTVYYLVEYSTNGGSSYSTASSNLQVTAGATNTSLSQAVAHGSTIIWRYKDSNASGSFGSASYTTLSASSTVDCPIIDVSAEQELGGCSSGAKTSTLTITNSDSANDMVDRISEQQTNT